MRRRVLIYDGAFLGALICALLIYRPLAPERRKVGLPPSPRAAGAAEELNAYAALFEQLYTAGGGKVVVIAQNSNDCATGEKEPGWEEAMLNSMPEVGGDTFGDYLVKNSACLRLNEHAALAGRYRVIPDEEVMNVMRNDARGWRDFYDRYPDAVGIVTISKIGFNPEMNQALVYSGLYGGVARAYGTHVLLTKHDGKWAVTQKYRAWGY